MTSEHHKAPLSDTAIVRLQVLSFPDISGPIEPSGARGAAGTLVSRDHGDPATNDTSAAVFLWSVSRGRVTVDPESRAVSWEGPVSEVGTIPAGVSSALACLLPLLADSYDLGASGDTVTSETVTFPEFDTTAFLALQWRLRNNPATTFRTHDASSIRTAIARAFGGVTEPASSADSVLPPGNAARSVRARSKALTFLRDESWRFMPAITAALRLGEAGAGHTTKVDGMEMVVQL